MSRGAATPLMNRGKTFLTGDPNRTLTSTMKDDIEGTIQEFDDIDPTVVNGAKTHRSNRNVVCVCVRNVAAAALLPKRVVRWKSGSRGRQVDGYCAVGAEECAGVVDEFLPSSGCPVNDLFWVTVKGPTLMLTDLAGGANNLIPTDTVLVALTAATTGATTAGRIAPQDLTGATAVLGGQIQNAFGRAMSAKTTANTNADILVDTFFLKSA